MAGLRMHAMLAVAASLAAPAAAAPIDARIDALATRVDRLESARAIRKLQRAFGYYMDRGLWSEAADLFTTDGTVEIGADGVYVGQPHIRAYLERLGGGQPGLAYGQLNEWLQLQAVVNIAPGGETATARWRDLAMLGHFKRDAAWRDGIYENTYRREGGVWKIAALHLFVNFTAPYDQGWARVRDGKPVPSEAAKAMPPDRPPTRAMAGFPDNQVPPFSYANPVSGRRWTGAPR